MQDTRARQEEERTKRNLETGLQRLIKASGTGVVDLHAALIKNKPELAGEYPNAAALEAKLRSRLLSDPALAGILNKLSSAEPRIVREVESLVAAAALLGAVHGGQVVHKEK